MTRIGLISDTHGFLDEAVFKHFENCDEIWHAGDFGSIELVKRLSNHWSDRDGQTRLKGVYGNIDDQQIRDEFPEQLVFMCEDVKVMIRLLVVLLPAIILPLKKNWQHINHNYSSAVILIYSK